MAKILNYPHPALRQKAKPVTQFDQNLVKLVEKMKRSLVPNPHEPIGVGLAANQIGILQRVFLMTMPASPSQGGPLSPRLPPQFQERMLFAFFCHLETG